MWKDKVRLVRDYIAKHRKIVFPVLIIAVVAVTLTIVFNMGDKRAEEILPADLSLKSESVTGDEDGDTEESPVEVPLLPNENEAIKKLIEEYYNAMATGDESALRSACDEIPDSEVLWIVETAKYIESCPVEDIYTKQGPEEGTTIVYVYYKVIFSNHEEPFPGFQAYYVCTDENGNLYIRRGENSDSVNDYIQKVNNQSDVIDFNNRINVEYNTLMEEHPELLEFLSELNAVVNTATGEALAEQVAGENEAQQDGREPENGENAENSAGEQNSDENGASENADGQPAENVVEYVKTTTTVNVRASDSEMAEKLGKVTQGTTLQVVEQQLNGWTKLIFEGKEGFIKSEFLQAVENVSNASVIGSVTAKTNINVRAEASETADRLGVLTGGESADLLANENGWCKINYNGKVGYVKAEYVE